DYPQGNLADDAIYQLATYYEQIGSTEKSLKYYEDLRNFSGENYWPTLTSARPAWMLYGRGLSGDLEQADNLLGEIIRRAPDDQIYLAALFWRARIAEDSNQSAVAQRFFKQVIETSPYGYYAIRARMHLNVGPHAAH